MLFKPLVYGIYYGNSKKLTQSVTLTRFGALLRKELWLLFKICQPTNTSSRKWLVQICWMNDLINIYRRYYCIYFHHYLLVSLQKQLFSYQPWNLITSCLFFCSFILPFSLSFLFFTHKNKILIAKDGIRVGSLKAMTSWVHTWKLLWIWLQGLIWKATWNSPEEITESWWAILLWVEEEMRL